MDDQVFTLINQNFLDLKSELSEVKADVKSLMKFKWKVVGIAMTAGSVIGIVLNVVYALIQR